MIYLHLRAERATATTLRSDGALLWGRLALPVCLGVVSACAAAPVKPEADACKLQLRALADRQQALEKRIAQLEAREAMAGSRRTTPAAAAPAPAPAASPRIPGNLKTVTLRPERQAPPVPTAVALREPDPQAVELILSDDDVAPEPKGEGQPDYDEGMKAISSGDVERGAGLLITFADKNKRSELAPKALFTAGIGLQNWGDPAGAAMALLRVSDDYPTAAEAPEAMVKLAECQLKLKNNASARAILSRVIDRYPSSRAAKVAQDELKSLGAPASSPQ